MSHSPPSPPNPPQASLAGLGALAAALPGHRTLLLDPSLGRYHAALREAARLPPPPPAGCTSAASAALLAATLLCGRLRFVGFGSVRRRSASSCAASSASSDEAIDCELVDALVSTGTHCGAS